MSVHTSVLLDEVVGALNPSRGDVIVDGTVNGGGHAVALLERVGDEGRVIGIDRDKEILSHLDKRITAINGDFRNMKELLAGISVAEVDGVLLDLGWSSYHITRSGRGFSFQKDEPLLMTYESDIADDAVTARTIVNMWNVDDIEHILREYGEERYSKRIALAIVQARQQEPIMTTHDLVRIVKENVPPYYRTGRTNAATKTFQALRIAVNDELEGLREGLEEAWGLLAEGGTLVVISFHSLEDRIVKRYFKSLGENAKPIVPGREEVLKNPRARSAKLRLIKK